MGTRPAGPMPPAALVAISFLGGAAALIHQLLWVRRLVDTVGATADTFASVIGAFFLGLALGGWIASRMTASSDRHWLGGAGGAELGIAALSFGVLFSPHAAGLIHGLDIAPTALRLGVAALLILPPAICMGLTTPFLIAAANTGRGRYALPIYAANTLGAVAGIFVGLVWLLPTFGMVGAGIAAASANGLIGLVLLSRSGLRWPTRGGVRNESTALRIPVPLVCVAFASGFLVLASEVVVQLQFTQVAINSLFASGFVLGLVLVGLGVGALLVPLGLRMTGQDATGSIGKFALIALLGAAVQPVLFWISFGGLDYVEYQIGALAYFRQIAVPGIVCVALPFLAMGLVFPALLRIVEDQGLPPGAFGRLLAWNGLGGWIGSEVAQAALLPKLGLWGSMPMLCAALALALAAWVRSQSKDVMIAALATVTVCATTWIFISHRPHVSPSPDDEVRALRIGREGVVAVVSHRTNPDDWRIIFNNSYTLGGSRAAANQERQAHLPILLHGGTRTVATLGLATGSTASGALVHPSVEEIDAIELSPLAAAYASSHFGSYNRNFLENDRVKVKLGDARWVIAEAKGKYDVIVGDLFLPWRTGEGRLFTQEHFQNVREALTEGGLFCQWLPMYQLTARQFDAIARTFLSVFPDAFIIRGDFYAAQPIIGLVGGRALESIDWDAVAAACEATRAETRDAIPRHVEGVAMMVVGPLAPVELENPAPIITLDNGWLEWNGGQNLLNGGESWFAAVPLGEFLRERHHAGRGAMPVGLARWHEAGHYFSTLSIAHEGNVKSDELLGRLPEYLPASMRNDPDIYWPVWPANIKPGVHVTWGPQPAPGQPE